ncbi:MucBP domain-containing protein, partial [Streptococcus sp. ZJ93]|uniref:MucBP domain-containing protein n=1 Tax=Streptococcus handemini TaxID=3161188 RepID=UPI0034D39FFD
EVVKDKDSGTDYQTKTDELRPPTLKTKDGKVYKLVPKGIYPIGSVDEDGRKEDSSPAGGKVTDKHQTVTYVYEEVKGGEVTAQYYVEGSETRLYPEASDQKDTVVKGKDTPVGTPYEDKAPDSLFDEDGIEYELVKVGEKPTLKEGSAATTGTVSDTPQTIKYQYRAKKGGEVAAQYFVEGSETRLYKDYNDKTDKVVKEKDTPVGTRYADEAPETLFDENGIEYELVKVDDKPSLKEGSAETTGRVTKTPQTIKYQYRAKKGGEVAAQYFVEGSETRLYKDYNDKTDKVVKEKDTPVGTRYADEAPETLFDENGVEYILVRNADGSPKVKASSAEPTGKVVEGKQVIQYEYKKRETPTDKPGKYIPYIPVDPSKPTDPNDPLTPPVNPYTGENVPPVPYDETPENPKDDPRLPDIDGFVPVDPKDPSKPLPKDPNGNYIPPTPENPKEDTPIPYVPAGSVTVHYVDEEGNVIKDPTVDTPESPVGTEYHTNKEGKEIPKEIPGKDGKVYELVKVKDGDVENGKIVRGITTVTYIYKLKETPQEEGELEVNYVDESGTPVALQEHSKGKPNDPYTTTPKEIDGYELVRVEGDEPKGSYINGKKKVTYVYKKKTSPVVEKGSVIVEYKDKEGRVITDNTNVHYNQPEGTDYNTNTDAYRPLFIKGYDGKTYKRVPVGTYPIGAVDEQGHLASSKEVAGKVVANTTLIVTYVYELVEEPTTVPPVMPPVTPEKPVTPPVKPVPPVTPPTTPEKPVTPPTTPVPPTPGKPVDSGKPVEPSKLAEPTPPAAPNKTAQPAVPAKAELPQTGDMSGKAAFAYGAAALGMAALLGLGKKKLDDEN